MKSHLWDMHYEMNQRRLRLTGLLPERGPIENQAAWGEIAFGSRGRSCMSYSGCGVIALWNALTILGKIPEGGDARIRRFADLLRFYEEHALVRKGAWGSKPKAAIRFLRTLGNLRMETVFCREGKKLDAFGERFPVTLVTAMNDRKDIRQMIHTVCIERRSTGNGTSGYVIHNAYRRDRRGKWCESSVYETLTEATKHIGRDSLPLITIGIR